jgi:hypothetical protein
LPGETIAGVEAQCFRVDVAGRIGIGPAGTEEIKICYSGDGQLLSMRRTITFADGQPPAEVILDAQGIGAASAGDFEPLVPPSGS